LVVAHRRLRDVDEAGQAAIAGAGEPIAADLVRLHRDVAASLAAEWYDVVDLRRVALAALRERPALGDEIGAVVVFLPQDLPPGATALLATLATRGALTVIAAATGDAQADHGVRSTVQSLHPGSAAPPDPHATRTATRVAHASDADDEVRCVVRRVTVALQSAPAHRVAVLYGAAGPYARLLAEHLDTAGISWNGPGVRPTIERTLPRALLDLLALPEHGWRRDEVMAVLSATPVRGSNGNRVPAARWERISRIAGIVADADWDTRLKAYAAQEHAAADNERAGETPRTGLIARRERDALAAHALRDFVIDLRGRLEHGANLRSWPQLAAWAWDTFRALIGDLADERWLPPDEARATEKIERVLSGLVGLDVVEATADLATLRLTLDLELADDLARHGRFGDGILVAPLSAAIGLDHDEVFVVGLSEDLVPGRMGTDALLSDPVRALTAGQVPSIRDRVDRRHRHLLAALTAAPACTVSFPRGDLRKSSTRLPSRWLLPSLRALSGQATVDATTWQEASGLEESPSYAAGLAATDDLATAQEWRMRAAAAARGRGQHLVDALPGDEVVARAVLMSRGRDQDGLTRFDGDLSGLDVPDPTHQAAISPTALEAWVRCPHAYFVGRMLWVEPVESPEELIQVSALDIGTLLHTALDRFFARQADAAAVPGAATAWTDGQRAQLADIAREAAADLAARGATGHPLLWRQELRRILADLDRLLDDDEQVRAGTGRRQERSELVFGMRGEPPVRVDLPDGRVLRMRGSADRVDRAGDTIVVVDYKSGSAKAFADLDDTDPTAGGSKLQLPVYAYAARAALGMPQAPVSAEYWFLRKDRGRRVTLAMSPQIEHDYAEVLTVIADGIAGGLFPHRPAEQDGWGDFIACRYCDPDGLGAADHRDRWARKRHDPRLDDYLRLVDPDAAVPAHQAQP
jgi:hypothetical protein